MKQENAKHGGKDGHGGKGGKESEKPKPPLYIPLKFHEELPFSKVECTSV